jgi:hypothetical protein
VAGVYKQLVVVDRGPFSGPPVTLTTRRLSIGDSRTSLAGLTDSALLWDGYLTCLLDGVSSGDFVVIAKLSSERRFVILQDR